MKNTFLSKYNELTLKSEFMGENMNKLKDYKINIDNIMTKLRVNTDLQLGNDNGSRNEDEEEEGVFKAPIITNVGKFSVKEKVELTEIENKLLEFRRILLQDLAGREDFSLDISDIMTHSKDELIKYNKLTSNQYYK